MLPNVDYGIAEYGAFQSYKIIVEILKNFKLSHLANFLEVSCFRSRSRPVAFNKLLSFSKRFLSG